MSEAKPFEEWMQEQPPPDPEEIRRLKAEIANLTKRIRGLRGGEEIIKTAVDEAFTEPPDLIIPKPPKSTGRGREETAILHLSDTQIGKVTETYNSAVADERIQRAAKKTAMIADLRRSRARVDVCKVYLGGDLVEGENIFPGQAHQIDQGVFDQAVMHGPAVFARAVNYLLGHFDKVEVWEVDGNHGRAASKGVGSHPRTNWDKVAVHVLRTMFSGPVAAPATKGRLSFHISDTWHTVDTVYGFPLMMVHGDQISGGFAGYPWYGVGRKALAWGESVRNWQGPRRFLFHGHFHQLTRWSLGQITVLGNGTTESNNEYARSEIGFSSVPEQRLAFFGPEQGLIADHALYLSAD